MPGVLKLQGARKAVALHMTRSLAETAQLSFHADCDVTALLRRRAVWKEAARRISIEDCAIAALARALAAYPAYNGQVQGDTLNWQEQVDVSVAMAVDGLLVTPVIRDAAALDLDTLADQRRALSAKAAAGTLKASEMTGGTVSISNLGLSQVRYFTPILNKGQLILLGLGRIEERLALNEAGNIAHVHMMGLSLTVDHRFVDGEPAARLLGDICANISAAGA